MRLVVDIDDRLNIPREDIEFVPPYVMINGEITEDTAAELSTLLPEMETLIKKADLPAIPLMIDSIGGDIYATLSMLDAMDICDVPIATIATGKAMSAAACILAAGTNGFRYAAPNATVMIHSASSMVSGNTAAIEAEAAEIRRLHNLMLHRMSKDCGESKNFFSNIIEKENNTEVYFSARRCKKLGIIDYIKIPTLTVQASLKYSFK